ncbi:ABC transporter permease [Bariatricus massiliensis]|uniref:ABC transporter permease n=2 Tax=Bariatricus massiliensis TaxID=1745713 RepID=A0ABS8DKJ9_9FIRM|nr:ABC transporter permease [Bariatricus massiliensis]MCB7305742.1 ABC transporter permease [Bariatricus massiliensis]MCB7376341.1 ABC transporter permease [Bariatricus massiliensis]MCB7388885.1 ABC transporter permease [Bariatricus massiliensis]MDY2663941.1 ABC transporter permease [Bariatricus massiliensis]
MMVKQNIKKVSGIMWASLLMVVLMLIFVPNFSQPRNFDNILKNTAVLLIISIGMTMAILSSQIDLSIGGVMSASAMISAMYLSRFEEPTAVQILITFLIGIIVGLAFGLINGVMIGIFKYNYWLVTFATMSMGYGLAQVVTNGNIIAGFSKTFRHVADGKMGGAVSNVIIITILIVVIMMLLLARTRFGMHIYAVGDSEQCAAQSGIVVPKIRILVYAISGILAGLGGVLLVSKTNSASATIGNGYEFDAIAAVIIGGTPFEGGKGGLGGTVIGALVIQAFKAGLQLMGVSSYWQQTLVGIFILLIIVVDVISENQKLIKKTRRIYRDE